MLVSCQLCNNCNQVFGQTGNGPITVFFSELFYFSHIRGFYVHGHSISTGFVSELQLDQAKTVIYFSLRKKTEFKVHFVLVLVILCVIWKYVSWSDSSQVWQICIQIKYNKNRMGQILFHKSFFIIFKCKDTVNRATPCILYALVLCTSMSFCGDI